MVDLTALAAVLSILFTIAAAVWMFFSGYLTGAKRAGMPALDWIHRWWSRLKWIAFANIFIQLITDLITKGHLGFWDWFAAAFNAICWYYWRNSGDDDFTKKLKKKLTETVARVGDKLVLIPARAA